MLIDLNCDLGEGAGTDAELLPLVTSANVSCGVHAGSPADIAATLEQAARLRRRRRGPPRLPGPRALRPAGATRSRPATSSKRRTTRSSGAQGPGRPVRGQGAVRQAARGPVQPGLPRRRLRRRRRDRACALSDLPVVGLPGSRLEARATDRVPFVPEGFADRRYRPDGSLVPRDQPEAFVSDPAEAARAGAAADRRARRADGLRPRRQPGGGGVRAGGAGRAAAGRGRAAAVRMSLPGAEPGHVLARRRRRPPGESRASASRSAARRTAGRWPSATPSSAIPPSPPPSKSRLTGPTLVAEADVGLCVFGAPFRHRPRRRAGRAEHHVHPADGPDAARRRDADRVPGLRVRAGRVRRRRCSAAGPGWSR